MRKNFLLNRMFCFFLVFTFLYCFPIKNNILFHSTIILAEEENNKITLNLKSKSLVKTDTFSLNVYRTSKNQKVFFKSSNNEIASAEKTTARSAIVTGNKVGIATITVIIKEDSKTVETLTCKVTVTPPAISVKIPYSSISLNVDDKFMLNDEIILKPNTTAEIPKYITSDPDIVSISVSGIITAHSKGEAVIQASINNGKYDSCKIIVSD